MGDGVSIERGGMGDYAVLARYHYRGGAPAVPVRVLRALHGESDRAIGVLVVAMPVLNARWRGLAWGEEYERGSKRARACRLNRDVRCIARVIVDPAWRGVGVAVRLVRAYLREPMTRRTEAVADMGGVCPFFERAGMRGWRIDGARCDMELISALQERGIDEWMLADPARVARRCARDPSLERELRRWARSRAQARGHARDGDVMTLCTLAGTLARRSTWAFAHERGHG